MLAHVELTKLTQWKYKQMESYNLMATNESKRLAFALKVPHEKYTAQFRQADLYLDTFTYHAGTTKSNALWA